MKVFVGTLWDSNAPYLFFPTFLPSLHHPLSNLKVLTNRETFPTVNKHENKSMRDASASGFIFKVPRRILLFALLFFFLTTLPHSLSFILYFWTPGVCSCFLVSPMSLLHVVRCNDNSIYRTMKKDNVFQFRKFICFGRFNSWAV